MYLYTVTGAVGEEGYLDLAKSGDLTGKNVYVNMTNKCPCSCVFCLRQTKQQQEGNTLWLKEGEPSVETMLELFAQYDLNVINELVFCGFGEPLERLEDVCRVIDSLKETYPNLKVRLNTIGLANLIYGRDVTPELKGRFDTVSISLNAPDEKEFLVEIRHPVVRGDQGVCGSFQTVCAECCDDGCRESHARGENSEVPGDLRYLRSYFTCPPV